jgi:Ankyrin repeats (3 copies)
LKLALSGSRNGLPLRDCFAGCVADWLGTSWNTPLARNTSRAQKGRVCAAEGSADAAVFNRNYAAAEHLLQRGAPLTLATALVLGRWEDVTRVARTATARDKQNAFVLAALHGKAEGLRRMIDLGVDVNAVSVDIYSHATPLHHAVCSGYLDAVKVLVEAAIRARFVRALLGALPILLPCRSRAASRAQNATAC